MHSVAGVGEAGKEAAGEPTPEAAPAEAEAADEKSQRRVRMSEADAEV